MKRGTKNTWLFAFTDLSFLLLICLSLIPSAPADISLHLAEMNLPSVPDNRNLRPVAKQEQWNLQIFPISAKHPTPYRLSRIGAREGMTLDEKTLIPALEKLRSQGIRPLLLPDKTSITQDFLFAAGALARVWSKTENRSIVRTMETGAHR